MNTNATGKLCSQTANCMENKSLNLNVEIVAIYDNDGDEFEPYQVHIKFSSGCVAGWSGYDKSSIKKILNIDETTFKSLLREG